MDKLIKEAKDNAELGHLVLSSDLNSLKKLKIFLDTAVKVPVSLFNFAFEEKFYDKAEIISKYVKIKKEDAVLKNIINISTDPSRSETCYKILTNLVLNNNHIANLILNNVFIYDKTLIKLCKSILLNEKIINQIEIKENFNKKFKI